MELAGIPGSEQLTTEYMEKGRERKEEGKMDQEVHVLFGRKSEQLLWILTKSMQSLYWEILSV